MVQPDERLDFRPFAEACGYRPRTLDDDLVDGLGVTEARAEGSSA